MNIRCILVCTISVCTTMLLIVGSVVASVHSQYPLVSLLQHFPFLSTVCSATSANGTPCNPAGGYAAADTGGCSGLPTNNSFDLVLVSPQVNNTPPGYILCDPSVSPLNTVKHISKPTSFFQFVAPKRNNLGLAPSSPVYRIRPYFRSCDRSLVGPKPPRWRNYLGRFNIQYLSHLALTKLLALAFASYKTVRSSSNSSFYSQFTLSSRKF